MKSDNILLDDLTGEFRTRALKEARRAAWAIILVFIIAVIWAAFATMNETVKGSGTIIPSTRMQTIQSLEGGILEGLYVAEGEMVTEGDLLLKIEDTQARSEYLEMKSEYEALDVEVQRLEAEVLGKDALSLDASSSEKARLEVDLFRARQETVMNAIAAKEEEIRVIDERIALISPMIKSGSISKVDVLELQQQRASSVGDMQEVRNTFVQEAYKNLVDKRTRMDSLKQAMLQREDKLRRTEVKARVSGRVNNINITTSGGVIRPGETIMEISPADDKLIVETLIAPRDVALVAPGMVASVKITAYDYSVYGDIRGSVVNISPDTVEGPDPQDTTPYYKVMVETERSFLERGGKTYPLRTGMQAEVDIRGEERSILNYIIRPLVKARLQ